MKRQVLHGIVTALMVAAAITVFLAGWCLWWSAVERIGRGGHERRETAVYAAEVKAPRAADAKAAKAAEDAGNGIRVYREGDGPAPSWYDPSEPMAAEWFANCNQHETEFATLQVMLQSDGVDYNAQGSDYLLDVPLDADLQAYIWTLCRDAGVPYTLVIAVIEAESTYRADVISATHDYGLMQINIICHDWLRGELGIEDFLDPRDNVLAGVYVLGQYYRLYGYASGALVAYNQGQASAEEMFANGVYETAYSRRVMGIMQRLEREGG